MICSEETRMHVWEGRSRHCAACGKLEICGLTCAWNPDVPGAAYRGESMAAG